MTTDKGRSMTWFPRWTHEAFRFATVLLVSGLLASAAAGQDDLGAKVREIFAARCTECHGPDLPRPKGRFGHVLDLEKLASDEAFVVVGEPDDSEIYLLLIEEDESLRMPPPAARAGQLTAAEIETVRRWIETGAKPPGTVESGGDPEPSDPGPSGEPPEGGDASGENRPGDREPADRDEATSTPETATETDPGSATGEKGVPPDRDPAPEESRTGPDPMVRLKAYLGKFHPLVVHFPIALCVTALLAELCFLVLGRPMFDGAGRFCILLAALLAPLSAGLGWLAGEYEGYSGLVLTLHRWFGVGAAALAVLTLFVSERFRSERSGLTRWHFRVVLFINAVAVGVTGHFGGALVYGTDHLLW